MLLLTEKEKQEKYQRNMPNRWKDEPNKHWKNLKEIRECAAQEIVRLNVKIKRFNNYSNQEYVTKTKEIQNTDWTDERSEQNNNKIITKRKLNTKKKKSLQESKGKRSRKQQLTRDRK